MRHKITATKNVNFDITASELMTKVLNKQGATAGDCAQSMAQLNKVADTLTDEEIKTMATGIAENLLAM